MIKIPCHNICHNYKVYWNSKLGSRYALGHKRCDKCEVFMKVESVYCPCCSIRLKYKPRNKYQKMAYAKALTSMQLEGKK